MELTLAALAFRQLLARRRMLGVLAFALLPVALAVVARTSGEAGNAGALMALYLQLIVPVTLPLCALVFGAAVFGSELEDGTITYVLGKPVARWRIALTRIVAAAAMTALVVVPSSLAAAAVLTRGVVDGTPVMLAFSAALAAGGLVYCALFVGLSLRLKRALLAGLGYVIVWEALLTRAFAGARTLSVRDYTLSIAHALAPAGTFTARLPAATAVVMATAVTVIACAYAVHRLRRLEIAQAA